jgi:hypothetical protein
VLNAVCGKEEEKREGEERRWSGGKEEERGWGGEWGQSEEDREKLERES